MWLTTLLKELACKNIRSNGHSYLAVKAGIYFLGQFLFWTDQLCLPVLLVHYDPCHQGNQDTETYFPSCL